MKVKRNPAIKYNLVVVIVVYRKFILIFFNISWQSSTLYINSLWLGDFYIKA